MPRLLLYPETIAPANTPRFPARIVQSRVEAFYRERAPHYTRLESAPNPDAHKTAVIIAGGNVDMAAIDALPRDTHLIVVAGYAHMKCRHELTKGFDVCVLSDPDTDHADVLQYQRKPHLGADTTYWVSTLCSQRVFNVLHGNTTVKVWDHAVKDVQLPEAAKIGAGNPDLLPPVGAGTTPMMAAVALCHARGHRHFAIHGFTNKKHELDSFMAHHGQGQKQPWGWGNLPPVSCEIIPPPATACPYTDPDTGTPVPNPL